jgi:alanyl-tRNA synthetase
MIEKKKFTSTAALKQAFLDYFAAHGHTIVPSASLIPAHDPSLLFTNAGMVPFKAVFLGQETRPYTRAVSVQRCIRAGGKHNDLENVGYTARHHTYFEMLGNFSFGDYFKAEAIALAWGFLTDILKLPKEKLWVTIYHDDEEAAAIWLNDIKIDPKRFSRIATSDNFWSMGDTGPCGPCSEIFYDHGAHIPGGPPGTPEADGDRYVEIWNLVFMQYNRDKAGVLHPLPKPSIDTGMGLERLAAVVQGVESNFSIDSFQILIAEAARIIGVDNHGQSSLKVIADHIRAAAFLIADGVVPSNEGRGYVLRRIIRRAIRHGYQLGAKGDFFHHLLPTLLAVSQSQELNDKQKEISQWLKLEESRFSETLAQGMHHFQQAVAQLHGTVIPGEVVFKLYDTYGFPADLTADVAREQGFSVDMAGFEAEMAKQRQRARDAGHFAVDYQSQGESSNLCSTFLGYEQVSENGKVLALYNLQGEAVIVLQAGEAGQVVLDQTPFYAESGGQVGDTGALLAAATTFVVDDTQKHGQSILHRGVVTEGYVQLGQVLTAQVNAERRAAIAQHHSATHLLHAALRQVLGTHVQQKGSLVQADRLRFDFSHYAAVSAEELLQIEQIVNAEIQKNHQGIVASMTYPEALAAGAIALFGEKYGDEVRTLRFGDFSMELCGGTHVARTGDIGLFKIVQESGIAAGIRRLEAVCGQTALRFWQAQTAIQQQLAAKLKVTENDLPEKVQGLLDKQKQLEKQLESLQEKLALQQLPLLAAQAETLAEVRFLIQEVTDCDAKSFKTLAENLRDKLTPSAVLLAMVNDDKVQLVAAVSKPLHSKVKAGEWVMKVAEVLGGKGGGRPDLAQAAGSDVAALPNALALAKSWLQQQLSAQ